MSNFEIPKMGIEGEYEGEDTSMSFLSKINVENNQQEEDDKETDTILNKGDDDYIPKTELDSNIEKRNGTVMLR